MADGRTKALADVRVGEEIYGTVRRGGYRHYVKTQVLNQWRRIKPAYRVELQDGTRLIASAEHRFLTNRGWKHVTGTMNGSARRPYLTLNNELLGTGRFAEPPADTLEYRTGYLCGIIRARPGLALREAPKIVLGCHRTNWRSGS